jgi:4-alpha-glucanotransferase
MRAAAPGAGAAPALGELLGPAYDSAANMPDWHKGRRAGIILHPTSLPGPNGIGELGAEAFAFLDWLADAGMQCWQVLPLVPPDAQYYSPYSGTDANCGNPLLISIDALITEGLLAPSDAPSGLKASGDVDFEAVAAAKAPLLSKAARALLSGPRFAALRGSLARFRADNPWIEDSALFDALRRRPELEGLEWWAWPEPLKLRDPRALEEARKLHAAEIEEFVAVQFLFDRQWLAVKVGALPLGGRV